MKSEGHSELDLPFTGPGNAHLASNWTLHQESWPQSLWESWLLHLGKMASPINTGEDELTLKKGHGQA